MGGARGARARQDRAGRAGRVAGRPGREGLRGARARQERLGLATGKLGRAGSALQGRLGCWAREARACKALGARAGSRRTTCVHLGVLAGLWAVHLVHSACF